MKRKQTILHTALNSLPHNTHFFAWIVARTGWDIVVNPTSKDTHNLYCTRVDAAGPQALTVECAPPVYNPSTNPAPPPSCPFVLASQVIRLLLEAGANPNYMTASGMTAVTVATIQSDVKSLATLLDAGAVPDRQRVSPNALQTAILNSSHVCLARLLRAGADPSMAYPKQPKKLVTMLREFWSKNAPRGSVVWQMRRIMYRAYAYTADSWRWPKHDPVVTTATSAAGGEGGEKKNEEGREQGCVGVKKRGTEEEQPSDIGKRATGVASCWRFRSRTADGNRRQVAVLNAMFRWVASG